MTQTPDNGGFPVIGVFTANEPIQIEMMPNGGWVVTQRDPDRGVMPSNLGAYSSAQDMIDALRHALIGGDT